MGHAFNLLLRNITNRMHPPSAVTIAARRFNLYASLITFYNDDGLAVAAYPAWRVLEIVDAAVPVVETKPEPKS